MGRVPSSDETHVTLGMLNPSHRSLNDEPFSRDRSEKDGRTLSWEVDDLKGRKSEADGSGTVKMFTEANEVQVAELAFWAMNVPPVNMWGCRMT